MIAFDATKYIDSAIKDGDHLVITRHGKAVVAMVPIEWYEANGGAGWEQPKSVEDES